MRRSGTSGAKGFWRQVAARGSSGRRRGSPGVARHEDHREAGSGCAGGRARGRPYHPRRRRRVMPGARQPSRARRRRRGRRAHAVVKRARMARSEARTPSRSSTSKILVAAGAGRRRVVVAGAREGASTRGSQRVKRVPGSARSRRRRGRRLLDDAARWRAEPAAALLGGEEGLEDAREGGPRPSRARCRRRRAWRSGRGGRASRARRDVGRAVSMARAPPWGMAPRAFITRLVAPVPSGRGRRGRRRRPTRRARGARRPSPMSGRRRRVTSVTSASGRALAAEHGRG